MRYALAILVGLGGAWLFGEATPNSVSIAGHEINLGCGMRELFGIPCPGCGMTRSVLMTLHGHVGQAVGVNPVGPVFLLGVLLLAVVLATNKMWRPMAVYGCVTGALLLVNWVVVLATR